MRKKFLSALMLGALTLAATSTITSCKDYDGDVADVKKDVTSLQELVKKLDAAIAQANNDHATKAALETAQKTLQDAIDKKADKAEVEKAIEKAIKEAQGALEAAINLKADATDLVTLQKEFADFKTLVSETYATLGQLDAALSAQATKNTGFENDIKALQNEVKAIKEKDDDLENRVKALESSVKDLASKLGDADILTKALAKDLRSLVYMPELYVGGIESIEYPFLSTKYMTQETAAHGVVTERTDQIVKLLNPTDYDVASNAVLQVLPMIAKVDYHMNPANAKTAYSDLKGFEVLEASVQSRATVAENFSAKTVEKYADGKYVFQNKDGVLSTGLQLEGSAVKSWLTSAIDAEGRKDYIVALKAMTKNGYADSIVTSDYAMLYPENVTLEGLAFKKGINGDNLFVEETCPKVEEMHLWSTPVAALKAYETPAFKVYCKTTTPVMLRDSIRIHINNANVKKFNGLTNKSFKLTDPEMSKLGLSYEFKAVEYEVGSSKTLDSRYCTVDPNTGEFWPKDVDANGNTVTGPVTKETCVGRQPLVQVLIKQGDNVVLDGYILFDITPTAQQPEAKDSAVVENYEPTAKEWAVCGDLLVNKATENNTWAQFDTYVLDHEKLAALNMTKSDFDANYTVDYIDITEETAVIQKFDANVFIYDDGKFIKKNDLGKIEVIKDCTGLTNYTFNWTISAAQLEKILDKNPSETVTVYFRFKNESKALNHIYIKLTTTVTRKTYDYAWSERIKNYWYDKATGADNGTNAIVMDVKAPRDNQKIINGRDDVWVGEIKNTLEGNVLQVNGKKITEEAGNLGKFYFSPSEKIVVAGWEIIPTGGDNYIYNEYLKDANNNFVKYEYSKLNEVINSHAIAFTGGVFNNNRLVAKKGDVTVEIAKMEQLTGQIELYNNEATKEMLNAVGSNHANIKDMLRATVGIAYCDNECNVARKVNDNEFTVAWQRPINVTAKEGPSIKDAQTNENKVNIFDFLAMTDWRNEPISGNNTWFMVYYQLQSVTIDLDNIMTNLNDKDITTTKLSDITSEILFKVNGNKSGQQTVSFMDRISAYGYADKNSTIVNDMKNHPDKYGQLIYENNGGNVKDFDVDVPVSLNYTWGSLPVVIRVHVERTAGN